MTAFFVRMPDVVYVWFYPDWLRFIPGSRVVLNSRSGRPGVGHRPQADLVSPTIFSTKALRLWAAVKTHPAALPIFPASSLIPQGKGRGKRNPGSSFARWPTPGRPLRNHEKPCAKYGIRMNHGGMALRTVGQALAAASGGLPYGRVGSRAESIVCG